MKATCHHVWKKFGYQTRTDKLTEVRNFFECIKCQKRKVEK